MNNKIKMDVLERQNQILKEENEKLKANQDYIAMMTDVEIPEEKHDEPEI